MENIGIIGCGNMGKAIAQRIKLKYKLVVFDKDREKTKGISGIRVADNVVDLVNGVKALILAVKPQDFDSLLCEIKNFVKDKLIISIAAGITTGYIEKNLGDIGVIRVMPNMPAMFGEGMSCICKGRFATKKDLSSALKIFNYLGKTIILNEDMMNAATAISGSGPAYVCEFLESGQKKQTFLKNFQKAAEGVGFNAEQAALLVNTTFSGTIELLRKTKLSPSELKKQVTSKGGTTEAALEVWEAGGTLEEAVKAAVKRAEELSRR